MVCGAEYVGLVLLDEADPGMCSLEAADGYDMEYATRSRFPVDTIAPAAEAIRTGQIAVGEDILEKEELEPPPQWIRAFADIALAMVVPVRTSEEVLGVMFVGWRSESPIETVAAREARHVESFAEAAALALSRVRRQQGQVQSLVLEDREQLAHELREGIIGRLFGIGTQLHSAAGLAAKTEVRRRIEKAIQDLDSATQDIVYKVLQLEELQEKPSIHEQILQELDAASSRLGFTPRLVVKGTFDSDLSPALEQALRVAIRDALAHVAERGSATKTEMRLEVSSDRISLAVTDDGAITDSDAANTYAQSLRTSADRLGGSCETWRAADGTTNVAWDIPLPCPAFPGNHPAA
jgi:signal transduction histidine kinase